MKQYPLASQIYSSITSFPVPYSDAELMQALHELDIYLTLASETEVVSRCLEQIDEALKTASTECTHKAKHLKSRVALKAQSDSSSIQVEIDALREGDADLLSLDQCLILVKQRCSGKMEERFLDQYHAVLQRLVCINEEHVLVLQEECRMALFKNEEEKLMQRLTTWLPLLAQSETLEAMFRSIALSTSDEPFLYAFLSSVPMDSELEQHCCAVASYSKRIIFLLLYSHSSSGSPAKLMHSLFLLENMLAKGILLDSFFALSTP